jgi:type VI protein secretion system component VasK
MTILFSERQHFTTPWLWILILGLAALFTYGAWKQLILGELWGSNPGPDWAILISWILAGVAIPALFASAHLRTEVRRDGIPRGSSPRSGRRLEAAPLADQPPPEPLRNRKSRITA